MEGPYGEVLWAGVHMVRVHWWVGQGREGPIVASKHRPHHPGGEMTAWGERRAVRLFDCGPKWLKADHVATIQLRADEALTGHQFAHVESHHAEVGAKLRIWLHAPRRLKGKRAFST
jgi:hypothetical protein